MVMSMVMRWDHSRIRTLGLYDSRITGLILSSGSYLSRVSHGFPPAFQISSHLTKKDVDEWFGYAKAPLTPTPLGVNVCILFCEGSVSIWGEFSHLARSMSRIASR